MDAVVWPYVVAGGIGVLVGAVEIFQRYRAEPLKAITNRWGLFYLVFNAGVAALAYWVLVLSLDANAPAGSLDLLQNAALAGFGAAALLRAKLMSVQTGNGKEVALGPEIVVQTFLDVIDRGLDRERARSRFDTVHRLMLGIDFDKAKVRLPIQIFQAMQGISEEEAQTLVQRIAEVDAMTNLESQDKSYLLGFYLLDLVGERFLDSLLPDYGKEYLFDLPAQGE